MKLFDAMTGLNHGFATHISVITKRRIDRYFPRFRNVYNAADDCPFDGYDYLIYTRMGAGNYRCTCNDEGVSYWTVCPYCWLKNIEKINKDTYIGGYDDAFDHTYRTLAFKFTKEQHELKHSIIRYGFLKVAKKDALRLFPKTFGEDPFTRGDTKCL